MVCDRRATRSLRLLSLSRPLRLATLRAPSEAFVFGAGLSRPSLVSAVRFEQRNNEKADSGQPDTRSDFFRIDKRRSRVRDESSFGRCARDGARSDPSFRSEKPALPFLALPSAADCYIPLTTATMTAPGNTFAANTTGARRGASGGGKRQRKRVVFWLSRLSSCPGATERKGKRGSATKRRRRLGRALDNSGAPKTTKNFPSLKGLKDREPATQPRAFARVSTRSPAARTPSLAFLSVYPPASVITFVLITSVSQFCEHGS